MAGAADYQLFFFSQGKIRFQNFPFCIEGEQKIFLTSTCLEVEVQLLYQFPPDLCSAGCLFFPAVSQMETGLLNSLLESNFQLQH